MSLFPSPARCGGIPPDTPHTVLISLPEWNDNVEISKHNTTLQFDWTETTYPRFVLHPFVKQLANIILSASKCDVGTYCLLFPSLKTAEECCSFAHQQCPQSSSKAEIHHIKEVSNTPLAHELFALFFPEDQRALIMKFWTFAGGGISSRLAEHCLSCLSGDEQDGFELGLPRHPDHVYSEYYKRHIPLSSAKDAKEVIRMRYSGITQGGDNIRGVPGVSIEDVFLYPTGMAAIWQCHQLLANTIGSRIGANTVKYAHVDVIYPDSYTFLGLASPGYDFFANDGIDDLERLLREGTPDRPAILALFTDVPGNPLLRTADLPRLRALADLYHFPIIIDETVGSYLGVQVLPFADVVVGSLTKVFSGLGNVLGGVLMLNPNSPFYAEFKAHMVATYEDTYFGHDALVMELNSREIGKRIVATDRNAEALADMLYAQSAVAGTKNTIVQEVFYPKYQTRENYERCRNTAAVEAGVTEIGYGHLLSVTFTSIGAAKVFYDSLQCYKAPTLGTVVTLAIPFVALTFSSDSRMQWARDHALEESLVRFSVGMEDIEKILNTVSQAITAAEQWTRAQTD
ncbi:PLP-dependent transferase [Phlegmacium glaucopus]|nr:PLP-dependent transferase [Phlegmacium glaucopus]